MKTTLTSTGLSKPIRLALLRCDGHAYTFGPMLAPCDPRVFARNFHVEFYFMIDAWAPEKLSHEPVSGFEIAKVWDPNPQCAQGVAELFFGSPKICGSVEEMTDGVDAAIINDQSLDGADHLALARPFIERGIPIFIDKPLAATLADAKTMVRLAEQRETPIYSTSILSQVTALEHLKRRFSELPNPVVRGVVNGRIGAKTTLAGAIHGLSIAQAVFGPGISSIESMGATPLAYLLLHYRDGREMLVVNAPHDRCGDYFYCDVYTRSDGCPPRAGHLQSNPIGDPDFVLGARRVIEQFKQMVLSRRPPVPYSQQLELIAAAEAGALAHESRRRVNLEELLAR